VKLRSRRWLIIALTGIGLLTAAALVGWTGPSSKAGAASNEASQSPTPTQPVAKLAPHIPPKPKPSHRRALPTFTATHPGATGSSLAASASSTAATAPAGPGGTLHYIVNLDGSTARATALGYNLFDMGPTKSLIDALPTGQQALVWLGSLDNSNCAAPSYNWADFTATVRSLARDPKVFGYFLADEPHPGLCPSAVSDIRQRADYIRAIDPTHKSFIVVLDGSNSCNGAYGCEFKALAPANTHVDYIGLDPYPCNTSNASTGCEYTKIDDRVHSAEANGIPAAAIVPVFQVFGQTCNSGSHYYRLPSAVELQTMLAHWAKLIPQPAFDYTYTWGRQGSSCPTLVDANGANGYPDLQSVMRTHNLG
jgi:hypothetical protein